jgi:hypothetical protein
MLEQTTEKLELTWNELAAVRCFYGGGNRDWGNIEIRELR